MTWSCDERFMTCIHDTISWGRLIGQNTALQASDWLKDCIQKITRESEWLLTQFPGSRLLTFLHASDPGPVTTLQCAQSVLPQLSKHRHSSLPNRIVVNYFLQVSKLYHPKTTKTISIPPKHQCLDKSLITPKTFLKCTVFLI